MNHRKGKVDGGRSREGNSIPNESYLRWKESGIPAPPERHVKAQLTESAFWAKAQGRRILSCYRSYLNTEEDRPIRRKEYEERGEKA